MAYKNWDNVRDHRLSVYFNQKEMDVFLEAMRIRDLEVQGKAARKLIVERSQQIIAEHRKHKPAQSRNQTVKYHLSHSDCTVFHPTKH